MKIKAAITVIKNNVKDNISYSISEYANGDIRSYNFTGSLTNVEGFVTSDGQDISKELVEADTPTTVIVNNLDAGRAIIEKAEQIFLDRELNGDTNPAIELIVEAKSLKVPGNILISFVRSIYVNEEVQIMDKADDILSNLKKASNRPSMDMANSMRSNSESKSGLLQSTSGFLKKYF